MIGYKRGDVVLIQFIFSDQSGVKLHPEVVISSNEYHSGRKEAIIAAITSQTDRLFIGDCRISDWKEAGLLFPSVATGILRTIKQDMINRKLGTISVLDRPAVEGQLRDSLSLK
jgi:mRNA interferase MazF